MCFYPQLLTLLTPHHHYHNYSIFKKKAPFMTASLRFYQSSYEYQADEAQADDMSGGDVGKQPDHQHYRLGEDPHQLYNRHQRENF